VCCTKPDETIAQRAMALAPYLPSGPFSASSFLDHAIGLNAVSNSSEADVLRDHLTDTGVIVRLGCLVEMWALADSRVAAGD
jgi:hypothetical protein